LTIFYETRVKPSSFFFGRNIFFSCGFLFDIVFFLTSEDGKSFGKTQRMVLNPGAPSPPLFVVSPFYPEE